MADWNPQANELFLAAVEISSPAERSAFLDRACSGDAILRRQVESLLAASHKAGSFLERPAEAFLQTVIDHGAREDVGSVIGRYKLVEQIGEGGFGIVYLAEQTEPVRRRVALKVLKPGMDTRQVIARFEAERQALALMDHPQIARVFDGGMTSFGRPYFVMELVPGVPITEFCDQHRLSTRERLVLFVSVCQAVQHAHQKGIIHRDLKPSNVLVSLQDNRPSAKVIDFGVAKALGQELTDNSIFTGFAQLIGTPLYMSPEQAGQGPMDIDTRSDVYSLGVLLYELLTGTTPFSMMQFQKHAYEEIRRIIREVEPPKPSTRLSELDRYDKGGSPDEIEACTALSPATGERRRGSSVTQQSSLASIAAVRKTEPQTLSRLLRGDLDWIVMKALEKDRTRRYATALGLAGDIQRYLADETVEACPPSVAYRFRKFAKRNKGTLAMGAVALVALLFALVGLATSNVLITAERDQKIVALGEKDTALREKGQALVEKELALAEARTNFEEARRQEFLAREHEGLARRRFYAAQLNLAMQAWEAGDASRTLELLESQRPAFDEEDLRSFEWYHLWRLCHRGLRTRLNHSSSTVYRVAFLPDGTVVSLSGSSSVGGSSIKVWDGRTAEPKVTMQSPAWAFVVSPDGKTIGSWGERDPVKLWDVGSGKQIAAFEGTLSLGFSPDGKTIALCKNADVEFRDLETQELRGVLHRKDVVNRPLDASSVFGPGRFLFSPDGKTAVVARHSRGLAVICRRDGADWREDSEIPGHGWFAPAAFSPDGTILAIGGDKTGLYAADTGQLLSTFAGHTGIVYWVAFAPDGQTLASAGGDRTVRFWSVPNGEVKGILPHPGPVYCVTYSPDGESLTTAGAHGTLRLWDTRLVADDHSRLQQTGGVAALALSPDGQTLVVSASETSTVWDLANRQDKGILNSGASCAVYSSDGGLLATVRDADIELWDMLTRTQAATLHGHKGTVHWIAISPDNQTLASASYDETVRLWDMATRRTRLTISTGRAMSAIAFSPDGKTFATGSIFEYVELWDTVTGHKLLELQGHDRQGSGPWCRAVVFSPDGKTLAAASQTGLVRLWDIATGRLRSTLRGHASIVNRLAFSPEGETLATLSNDGTVRLWDTVSGQEKMALDTGTGADGGLSFSRDGNVLVAGRSDGVIKIWQSSREPEATDVRSEFDAENANSLAALIDAASRLRPAGQIAEADRLLEEALNRLEKMAAQFPDDDRHRTLLARGRNQLAWQFVIAPDMSVRDVQRGLALAQQAVAFDPQSWGYRYTLGVACYRAGHWNEAEKELDRALQSPSRPEAFVSFFPAMSYWKAGHRDKAREAYEVANRIMEKFWPNVERYLRERAEAAELLGMRVPGGSS